MTHTHTQSPTLDVHHQHARRVPTHWSCPPRILLRVKSWPPLVCHTPQKKGETPEDEGQEIKSWKSAGGSELTGWTSLLLSQPKLKRVSSAGVLNETTFYAYRTTICIILSSPMLANAGLPFPFEGCAWGPGGGSKRCRENTFRKWYLNSATSVTSLLSADMLGMNQEVRLHWG